MSDKILSDARQYLRKVCEAIQSGALGWGEVIEASTMTNKQFQEKLRKQLPFPGFVIYGMKVTNHAIHTGTGIASRALMVPCQSIVKPNYKELTIEKAVSIAAKPFHKKLYRLRDCHTEYVAPNQAPSNEVIDNYPFHLLNLFPYFNGAVGYWTPVDEIDSVAFESSDRAKTWEQIHKTVETIAADNMKDNGIRV